MLSGVKIGKKKVKKAATNNAKAVMTMVTTITMNDIATETPTQSPPPQQQSQRVTCSSSSSRSANEHAAALLKQQQQQQQRAANSGSNDGGIGNANAYDTYQLSRSGGGDISVAAVTVAFPDSHKPMEDWTVAEMAAAERWTSNTQAHCQSVRDVLRQNKHVKKRRKFVGSDEEGEEEEEFNMEIKPQNQQKQSRRQEQQQQHAAWKDRAQMSRCALNKSWWWFESENFNAHRLLDRTEYVTLVWAPPPPSWKQQEQPKDTLPMHFFLVPVAMTPSLRASDVETVMKDVLYYHDQLQSFYSRYDMSVVLTEYYNGSSFSFLQAKVDVWIVPNPLQPKQRVVDLLPLYVRQGLAEQGGYEPHSLIQTGPKSTVSSSTLVVPAPNKQYKKPLHSSIPAATNFSYVYIQYNSSGEGAVQLLDKDNTSHHYKTRLSHSFWPEVLAAAVGQSRRNSSGGSSLEHRQQHQHGDKERLQIQAFVKEWQSFRQRQQQKRNDVDNKP